MDKIDYIYYNKTKSFIVTITKNTAIDEYRKTKKEGEKVEKVIERVTNSYIIETNEETEILTRLEMAIYELPDKYKIVFLLKYTQGYDYDEIGKLLNIKSATVRSRVLRGKEKFTIYQSETTENTVIENGGFKKLSYLPSGFKETDRKEDKDSIFISYSSDEGYLTYSGLKSTNSNIYMDTEDAEVTKVMIILYKKERKLQF